MTQLSELKSQKNRSNQDETKLDPMTQLIQEELLSIAPQERIYQLINYLADIDKRDFALSELSSKRENIENLAPMLWHSFGSIAILCKEIIVCYQYMNPPNLSVHLSNRVCNVLALLQCIASHHETRTHFLDAQIPLFLYPFLQTNNVFNDKPFEYLKLTSLGVIGALVKSDEQQVINFLLSTEIIPLCLRIMESGSELTKTVAIFILQKILLDDAGLNYVCYSYHRFSHVAIVLGSMVNQAKKLKEQSARLFRHIIRCYLRLADNPRAREALRLCLPDDLKKDTFDDLLREDKVVRNWLDSLLKKLESTLTSTIN